FEMHVRAGRAAGVSDQGENVTPIDRLTHVHQYFVGMSIPRRVAVAMVDLHHVAVAAPRARPGHDAGRDRTDPRALRGREVDPLVKLFAAGERIDPLTEARRDIARVDGTALRMDLLAELAREDDVLQRRLGQEIHPEGRPVNTGYI